MDLIQNPWWRWLCRVWFGWLWSHDMPWILIQINRRISQNHGLASACAKTNSDTPTKNIWSQKLEDWMTMDPWTWHLHLFPCHKEMYIILAHSIGYLYIYIIHDIYIYCITSQCVIQFLRRHGRYSTFALHLPTQWNCVAKVTSAQWPGELLGTCIVENRSHHVAQIYLPSGLEAQNTYVTLLSLKGAWVLQGNDLTQITSNNACARLCFDPCSIFQDLFGKK